MSQELADSIKRCLADCARLGQFETRKALLQLVELVAEMRDVLYGVQIGRECEVDYVEETLTKSDALLTKLGKN